MVESKQKQITSNIRESMIVLVGSREKNIFRKW